ncbi:MAG: hypothetical protein P4N59_03575 [Negativicutes bacterium]|nr:hypothetical protein [Negativicutes bacterium]
MNIYEAAKLVVTESQYKLVRMKKNSTPDQLDVKDHEGNKKGWIFLDGVTANLIVKVTEALGEENRAKFLSLNPLQAVNVAWKLVK